MIEGKSLLSNFLILATLFSLVSCFIPLTPSNQHHPFVGSHHGGKGGEVSPNPPPLLVLSSSLSCNVGDIPAIKQEVHDLHLRIDHAFKISSSQSPTTLKKFRWEHIKAILSRPEPSSNEIKDFCEHLAQYHFAVVSLSRQEENSMHEMWRVMKSFFSLDEDTKTNTAGPFTSVDGAVGIVGYAVMPDGNEFLETRTWSDTGEISPSIEGAVPGAGAALAGAGAALGAVGRASVAAALGSVLGGGAAAAAGRGGLVDFGGAGAGQAGEKRLSATQHRFCRYMSKQAVTFGAHTDTTFVTLIPCSNIPGLEVFSPALDGWVRPEPACRPGRDIIILPGELLQVLSAGHYPAAVHRVVSVGGGTARVSAPLLVRPNPSAAVNAEAWLCPGGGNGADEGRGEGAAPPPPPAPVAERLRALDGMNMRDLHQHLVDAFRDMEA